MIVCGRSPPSRWSCNETLGSAVMLGAGSGDVSGRSCRSVYRRAWPRPPGSVGDRRGGAIARAEPRRRRAAEAGRDIRNGQRGDGACRRASPHGTTRSVIPAAAGRRGAAIRQRRRGDVIRVENGRAARRAHPARRSATSTVPVALVEREQGPDPHPVPEIGRALDLRHDPAPTHVDHAQIARLRHALRRARAWAVAATQQAAQRRCRWARSNAAIESK